MVLGTCLCSSCSTVSCSKPGAISSSSSSNRGNGGSRDGIIGIFWSTALKVGALLSIEEVVSSPLTPLSAICEWVDSLLGVANGILSGLSIGSSSSLSLKYLAFFGRRIEELEKTISKLH